MTNPVKKRFSKKVKCPVCGEKKTLNRPNVKYCSTLCYARAEQRRRRERRKRNLTPTNSYARSAEEEDYMEILLPLGYEMNTVRIPYLERGLFQKWITLDFALRDEKINIEIDGAARHQSVAAQLRDRGRDAILRKMGWRVIRIRNYPLHRRLIDHTLLTQAPLGRS